MPRRRRSTRTVRRPNFQPAPEPQQQDEEPDDAEPTFADEPAVSVPAYGSGGPVETRQHWLGRDERAQGRRMAQLRRSSREDRVTPRSSSVGMLPTFAAGYIGNEIRQILITTGVMVVVIIALTLALR